MSDKICWRHQRELTKDLLGIPRCVECISSAYYPPVNPSHQGIHTPCEDCVEKGISQRTADILKMIDELPKYSRDFDGMVNDGSGHWIKEEELKQKITHSPPRMVEKAETLGKSVSGSDPLKLVDTLQGSGAKRK